MTSSKQLVLGVEGGGTKTDWVYISREGGTATRLRDGRLSCGNFKLISEEALIRLLRALPAEATHVGVFLAGCSTDRDRARLRDIVASIWPTAEISVGSDRNSGLATCFSDADGIAVIAGTGSAVHGRKDGRVEKAGGWGQLLGDRGGGYDLAMQGLRYCLRTYDLNHRTTDLARAILRDLGLNSLDDLVTWVKDADKLSVAKLAPVIFQAAREGEDEVRAIVDDGARRLAEYTNSVAKRLALDAPEVRLLGGIFVHHPEYVQMFKNHLAGSLPEAHVEVCSDSGAMGAAWLASGGKVQLEPSVPEVTPDDDTEDLALASTEQINPRSSNLDELDLPRLVDLFVSEEERVTQALSETREKLCAAVELVTRQLSEGGRLFYVGAGTSGRLGVLDASEIPPTFGAPPEMVQGIIAGGFPALHRAVEGAEDRDQEGVHSIMERGVSARDVVCGITASGRTPFVLGALRKSRELGARTMLLTCNPKRKHSDESWDVEIDIATGPELITGSTRLKAGTATKLALNIISTCTMIRLGKVRGNLMIDVNASNVKLRNRAVRILSRLRGCSYEKAEADLAAHNWNIRECMEP